MPRYLLDSDVIISYLRGYEEGVGLLNHLTGEGEVSCSVASVFEVLVGLRLGEEQRVEGFFAGLRTYAIDLEVAARAGVYGRRLRREGVTVDDLDLMIGVTAAVHDLTLVTFNPRHYPMDAVRIYGGESK